MMQLTSEAIQQQFWQLVTTDLQIKSARYKMSSNIGTTAQEEQSNLMKNKQQFKHQEVSNLHHNYLMIHFYNLKPIDPNYRHSFLQEAKEFTLGNQEHKQHLKARFSLHTSLDCQIPAGQKYFLNPQKKHFEVQTLPLKNQNIFSQQQEKYYHRKNNVKNIEETEPENAKIQALKNRTKNYPRERRFYDKLPQMQKLPKSKNIHTYQFLLNSSIKKKQHNRESLEALIKKEMKNNKWNREFIKPMSNDVNKYYWQRNWRYERKNQNIEMAQQPKWLSFLAKVNNIY